jgi:hypothetical protein
MKRIYAYYESIQTVPQPEEFQKANYWKTSWEKNGWECVMLNKSHAQGSNLHAKLIAKLMKVALGMPQELLPRFPHLLARYSRLAALHAAGGGWLSDYDVVNIGFTPEMAEKYENNTLIVAPDVPSYLFYATREHCGAMISKLLSCDIVKDGKILAESEILDVNPVIDEILFNLRHCKDSNEMKEAIS